MEDEFKPQPLGEEPEDYSQPEEEVYQVEDGKLIPLEEFLVEDKSKGLKIEMRSKFFSSIVLSERAMEIYNDIIKGNGRKREAVGVG